jgi:hypothetical protein
MSPTRASTVDDVEAQVAFLTIRLVALAETIGLVPLSAEAGVDRDQIFRALDAFARVGVGRRSATLTRSVTPSRLAEVLRDVLTAIEQSPLPAQEWQPLAKLLGDDALAQLVGTSVSSTHRYRSGDRSTPDAVAARLHTVALIAADLAGSYNDFGIRRWFQRSRSALDGLSPSEILTGDWSPDDERVQDVRTLAQALLGSPAT